MAQYAQYNPAITSPSPVIGWYDTEIFTYPNLPAASSLVAVTPAQWTAHFANPSGWVVNNGQLAESA